MTIDHVTDLIAPNFSNELYAIALYGIVSWFFVSKTYPLHLIIVGIIRLCVYGNISLLNF